MLNKSHIEQNEIDPISKSILWFAAVDIDVLQKTNRPIEIYKYVGLGILTILACAFAGCSAFIFTSSLIANGMTEQLRATVSTSWGLFVFAIDRMLLTSFKKKEFSAKKIFSTFLITIIFRIALVFTLASFVSTEIESIIFASEISVQSLENKTKSIKEKEDLFMSKIYQREDIKPLSEKIKKDNDQLVTLKSEAKDLQAKYLSEADGSGGTKKRGLGDIAVMKEQAFKNKKGEIIALEKTISQTEVQRKNIMNSNYKNEIDRNLKEINETIDKSKGPLDKEKSLNNYIENHPEVKMKFYTVKALLILIELMPMLLKSLAPYSDYDKVLRLEDEMQFSFNKSMFENEQELHVVRIENSQKIEKQKLTILYEIEEEALRKFKNGSSNIQNDLEEEFRVQYSEYFYNRSKKGKNGNENSNQSEPNSNGKSKKHTNKILGWVITFMLTGITGTKDTFVGSAKMVVDFLKSVFNKSK
jgi:hypothetical protein